MVIVYLMQNHGFKCIAKEADLTCELLRLEAPIDDYLINQCSAIRLCALGLMNCTGDNSVSASAVMLVRACLQKTHLMLSFIHPFGKPMITTYGSSVKLHNISHPFLSLMNCTLHDFLTTNNLSALMVY